MFIRSTKIVIPYTLQDSTEQRGMSILCKYCDKSSDNTAYLYKTSVNKSVDYNFFTEPVNYIGYSDRFILKQDPMKYISMTATADGQESSTKYIRLYFPIESIATYYRGRTKYLVSIYMYVNNIRTYLYSDVIDTFEDCKACVPFVDDRIHYQEYCDIDIPDPNTLITCDTDEYLLNINIHPIIDSGDVCYIPENCMGGSSFISFTQSDGMDIDTVFDISTKSVSTGFTFSRRHVDSANISEYIKNIYFAGISDPEYTLVLHYYLINRYDEEVYVDNPIIISGESTIYTYTPNEISGGVISGWEDWTEGLLLKTQFEVYGGIYDRAGILDNEWEDDKIVTINGNTLSINADIFKYFVPIKPEYDNIISFDNINMNTTEVTVYNKVVSNNIKVNQNSVGSGVVKPLFYRAYEIQSIILHRDMKENICVNLDEYKGKCDKFYLKLCGNYFSEYARNYDGVIFNINGSCITSATGTYYICDSDKNFITSGKYKCE